MLIETGNFSSAAAIKHNASRLKTKLFNPKAYRKITNLRNKVPTDLDHISVRPFLENECIFLHVPKCGGLSIAKSLFKCRAGAHIAISGYKQIFTYAEFSRFFKFTFVRNPWDRLVSAYFFLKDGGIAETDADMARNSVDLYPGFEAFVMNYVAHEDVSQILHFRPQCSFICPDGNRLSEIDFLGRFERIGEDFDLICQRLDIPNTLKKRNAGKTRPKAYQDLYTEPMKKVVARVYARDIELLQYSFDG
ncbi:MAG: sulfotransferase family protein [Pseudomonadota bacterium]